MSMEHEDILDRVRLLKSVIGTALILTLIVVIVCAFSLQSFVHRSVLNEQIQRAKEEPIRTRNRSLGGAAALEERQGLMTEAEIESLGEALQYVNRITLGAVIFTIAVHLFLLWAIFAEVIFVVSTCAVLLTMDVCTRIAFWQSTSIYTAAFLFDVFLALLAYYMSYLLIRERRIRTRGRMSASLPRPSTPRNGQRYVLASADQ